MINKIDTEKEKYSEFSSFVKLLIKNYKKFNRDIEKLLDLLEKTCMLMRIVLDKYEELNQDTQPLLISYKKLHDSSSSWDKDYETINNNFHYLSQYAPLFDKICQLSDYPTQIDEKINFWSNTLKNSEDNVLKLSEYSKQYPSKLPSNIDEQIEQMKKLLFIFINSTRFDK